MRRLFPQLKRFLVYCITPTAMRIRLVFLFLIAMVVSQHAMAQLDSLRRYKFGIGDQFVYRNSHYDADFYTEDIRKYEILGVDSCDQCYGYSIEFVQCHNFESYTASGGQSRSESYVAYKDTLYFCTYTATANTDFLRGLYGKKIGSIVTGILYNNESLKRGTNTTDKNKVILQLTPAFAFENSEYDTLIVGKISISPYAEPPYCSLVYNCAGGEDNKYFFLKQVSPYVVYLLRNTVMHHQLKQVYSIRLRTSSEYGAREENFVIPVVKGSNHPPTDILLDNSEIGENLPPETVVGNLTTVDADSLAHNTFSLVSFAGQPTTGLKIVGNKLLTDRVLDYEASDTIKVRIQVNDNSLELYSKGKLLSLGIFTKDFIITVKNKPECSSKPVIAVDGTMLTSSSNNKCYWYQNGNFFTSGSGVLNVAGWGLYKYTVISTDSTGCASESEGVCTGGTHYEIGYVDARSSADKSAFLYNPSGSNYSNYKWFRNDTLILSNQPTVKSPTTGTYQLQMTDQASDCPVTTSTFLICGKPTLKYTGDSLIAPAAFKYKWWLNDTALEDSMQRLFIGQPGTYKVSISCDDGDFTSDPFAIVVTGSEKSNALSRVYPNPTDGPFFINLDYPHEFTVAYLYNGAGQFLQIVELEEGNAQLKLDISDQPKGIFLVTLTNLKTRLFYKVVRR
jgi:hypothetical protein